jgi:hypothetical protein
MNIIYVSNLCSKNKYKEVFKNTNIKPGLQVQKYHRLMVEGLSKNPGITVKALTILPVNRSNCRKKIIKYEKEVYGNIEYYYIPIINLPVLKNIFAFLCTFFYTIYLSLKYESSTIISDVLNISISAGSIYASKILKGKNVGIVTDIPFFFKNQSKIIVKINSYIIGMYKSYIFLSENMNHILNKKGKPHIVIEGQVDIEMRKIDNDIKNKHNNKICLYAGAVAKQYGLPLLVQAFINANIKNVQLHIYGSNDYDDELKEICKTHNNIKYFGIQPNDYIVNEEIKATLLINPRPTNEEYTRYSFPSKNMEYMVSGTPTLTTRLPSMPKEYYNYVYTIEQENVECLSNTLKQILSKSDEELNEMGKSAKEFVLTYKNNVFQAKKIINMILEM